jgi:hypothetical protein
MVAFEQAWDAEDLYEDVEVDESYDEWDESDELEERRRRRGRRPPRINPGRVARPGGVVRPPAPTGNVVTRAELAAGLTRLDKKIETNAEAIKKVTAQANRVTANLGAATNRLDKQVGDLRKEVKKHAETSLLLTLLSKPPAIKATPQTLEVPSPTPADPDKTREIEVVGKIEVEKQSNLLPLVLLSGQGGMGGDGSNMLILALALSGQV